MALSDKQRRYLFAQGILGSKNGKTFIKDRKKFQEFQSKQSSRNSGNKKSSVRPGHKTTVFVKGKKGQRSLTRSQARNTLVSILASRQKRTGKPVKNIAFNPNTPNGRALRKAFLQLKKRQSKKGG